MDAEIDEFPRRKNSPLRSQAGFLSVWRNDRRNAGEMGHENDPTVTTSHVFWPNQRRRVAWLLPIWIRNSAVLGRGYDQQVQRGGGGVQPAAVAEIGRSKTSHGNF